MDVTQAGRGLALVLPRLKQVVLKRSGVALALWGEPGIGKSHAAQQVVRELSCRSFSFHAAAALSLWVRGMPRPSGPKALPAWAEPLLDKLQNGEAVEAKKTTDALGALLVGLSPVVLCLEDIHEASPERLELIQALARMVGRSKGVGLLATSRIAPPDGFEAHRLEPLSSEASQALLEAEVGNSLPKEALEWIFAKAAGNPLFTLEYLRYLARQGILWNDAQRWHWREPPARTLPLTVEALLEQTLAAAQSDPAAHQVLGAWATLGGDAEQRCHMAVAQLAEADFRQAEGLLQDLGILRGHGFAHPLYREVALRSLSAGHRRDLARRAIEALAETNLPVAVGFVAEAELGAEQSFAWYKRAAEQEQASGNPVNAARLLAEAVPYAPDNERGKLALEAAQRLNTFDAQTAEGLAAEAVRLNPHDPQAVYFHAWMLSHLRRGEEAKQVLARLPTSELESPTGLSEQIGVLVSLGEFQQAVGLWRAHPELEATATPQVLRRVGVSLANLGDTDGAYGLIAEGLAHPDLQPEDRAALTETLGIVCFYQSNYAEAEQRFAEALTLFGVMGQARRASATHFNHALALQKMGRNREASHDIEQSARLAGQTGDIQNYTLSQLLLGDQLIELGQYERAEEVLQANRLTVERWPLSVNHIEVNGNLNDLYRDWGSSHSGVMALKHGHAALNYARQLANPRFLPEGLFYASISEARFGSPHKALELSLEQEQLAQELKEPRQLYRAAWAKGTALVALGRSDEGLAELQRAHGVASEHGAMLHGHKLGLEVARLTHDLCAAREHLSWFEERGLNNGASIARRYFPELVRTGSTAQPQTNQPPHEPSRASKPSRRQADEMPETWHVLEVLGPMQLRTEGSLEAVRGQKRKELLALLLQARIAGRSEVSSLQLIEALYPETPDQEALDALKQMVSKTRTSFGQGLITTAANGYALGAVESDAELFLASANAALWRGPYLQDSGLEGDALVEDALYQALSHKTRALLEADPKEASRLGRILLEADPYSLDALRLTLEALRLSKNHRSLARLYEEARGQLLEVGEPLPADWSDFLNQAIA